jgi:hydroxymethylbilane synthase
MEQQKIIIGSRGSDLALWQANHIKNRLQELGAEVEIKIFKTQGDKIQHLSLDKLEGKGFFTKELEDALLSNEIDLAVHSHKDLPTVSPSGLIIAAVSEREDPSELILIRKEAYDGTLEFSFKKNAIIGTSSARRKAQLLSFRKDVEIKDIRGNVPTRIQKLRDGQFDAILLAKAGVSRLELDLSDLIVYEVNPKKIVPAPAQGVLALQIRESDQHLFEFLQRVHQVNVQACIGIERKLLNLFEGGCHMPLGAYAIEENNIFKLWVSKANEANDVPQRLYIESNVAEGMAERALNLLNANPLKGKKIFISRNTSDVSFLKTSVAAAEAELIGITGIQTNTISLTRKDFSDAQIIFFNSKNAVQHFFVQEPMLRPDVKFAAFGPGTEKAIYQQGVEVDFSGKSSDPMQVAAQFLSKFADGKRIVFPKALQSLQSVSSILSRHHFVEQVDVYETSSIENVSLPDADVYVFTSPSNVTAFTSSLESINTKVVAIGPSTAEALSLKGIKVHAVSERADDAGLLDAITSVVLNSKN